MAITQRQVWIAVNTPGGPVYEYRDKLADRMERRARTKSPKNKTSNAKHRGGRTGTYRIAWKWERFGNQNGSGLRIGNYAGHALFVEEGRSMSTKYQRFSWSRWLGQIRYIGKPPKNIFAKLPRGQGRRGQALGNRLEAWYRQARDDPEGTPTPWGGRKTRARRGQHVLRNAANYVLTAEGLSPIA